MNTFAILVEGVAINSKHQQIAQKGEVIDESSITYKTGVYSDDIFMEANGVIGLLNYELFRKLEISVDN